MLKAVKAECWIINGDWMDSIKLSAAELSALEQLKQLPNCRATRGNHDPWFQYHLLDLGNIRLVGRQVRFPLAGKKFVIRHGDKWDNHLQKHPIRMKLLTVAYWLVKPVRWFYDRYVINGTIWENFSESIAYTALAWACQRNIDIVIAGHTHKPLKRQATVIRRVLGVDVAKKALYINTGSLTEEVCYLTTIGYDGEVTIHQFSHAGEYLGVYTDEIKVLDLAV